MKPLFLALLLLAGTAFAQEDKLIAILKSDAPLKDKADACQELARVGTRQAVPVLATLLADEQLSHRARSALEPIADPRSTPRCVRRSVTPRPLLVGVIHSLGVRRDAQAVEPLAASVGADPDGGAGRGAGAGQSSEARLSRHSRARCPRPGGHPSCRLRGLVPLRRGPARSQPRPSTTGSGRCPTCRTTCASPP
jgi:hypothetical protein